MKFGS